MSSVPRTCANWNDIVEELNCLHCNFPKSACNAADIAMASHKNSDNLKFST